MSFSDLMSSARGPGVIGMFLALFVLIGFGTLFMFAFDESSTGGKKSLAAIVRDQEKEIVSDKARIATLEEKLARIPALKKTSEKLRETTSLNKSLRPRIEKFKSRITAIHSENERFETEVEDYKNEYRAAVRTNAAGSKIGDLKIADGENFTDVEIRKVTAIGIEIRHKNGFKRINFEELPAEMQDYYQFDANQMQAEQLREAKVRKKHNQQVAAANQAAEAMAADRKAKEAEEAKQRAVQEIAIKTAKLKSIDREIRQLESEVASAENAAEAARASGRMHLNKSNQFRNRLSMKRSEYSRMESEIARLRASL